MTESLDRALTERFALQHDELQDADFADVRRRAEHLYPHDTGSPTARRRIRLSRRFPTRVALAAAVVAIAGGATAIAVHALTQPSATQGFSALTDGALPEVTPSTAGVPSRLANMLRDVMGPEYAARQVGDGMFLGQQAGSLCEVVEDGAGQCADHLDGNVWLFGDMTRASDSEQAVFNVHLYGFARDDITTVRITTANGSVTSVPVEHNAFQTTLADTSFGDITAIVTESTSGETTAMNPQSYFPASAPVRPVTAP